MALPKLDPRSLAGALRKRALALPETTEDFPWGERAIKVRGKAFLFLRAEGTTVSFSVKLPRSAAEALELPYVEPTHYGLGKHGWVTAIVDASRDAPLATFEAWLTESYRAVAPKRLVAQLDAER
jgi:predicted DNA-binding protein (MmcQ/YjbR family)